MIRVLCMEAECAGCESTDVRSVSTRKAIEALILKEGWAKIRGQWLCPNCCNAWQTRMAAEARS